MADAVPPGYHTINTFVAVEDAEAAIAYYGKAFGARERMRMPAPGGKIAHAELEIGDSVLMLADPSPEQQTVPPAQLGGTSASNMLYVEDCDATIAAAVAAGARVTMEAQDMFWGDRLGAIIDPFGHNWQIATHVEDVSQEEIERRLAAFTPTPGVA